MPPRSGWRSDTNAPIEPRPLHLTGAKNVHRNGPKEGHSRPPRCNRNESSGGWRSESEKESAELTAGFLFNYLLPPPRPNCCIVLRPG